MGIIKENFLKRRNSWKYEENLWYDINVPEVCLLGKFGNQDLKDQKKCYVGGC